LSCQDGKRSPAAWYSISSCTISSCRCCCCTYHRCSSDQTSLQPQLRACQQGRVGTASLQQGRQQTSCLTCTWCKQRRQTQACKLHANNKHTSLNALEVICLAQKGFCGCSKLLPSDCACACSCLALLLQQSDVHYQRDGHYAHSFSRELSYTDKEHLRHQDLQQRRYQLRLQQICSHHMLLLDTHTTGLLTCARGPIAPGCS
jgi:hypothetical protein